MNKLSLGEFLSEPKEVDILCQFIHTVIEFGTPKSIQNTLDKISKNIALDDEEFAIINKIQEKITEIKNHISAINLNTQRIYGKILNIKRINLKDEIAKELSIKPRDLEMNNNSELVIPGFLLLKNSKTGKMAYINQIKKTILGGKWFDKPINIVGNHIIVQTSTPNGIFNGIVIPSENKIIWDNEDNIYFIDFDGKGQNTGFYLRGKKGFYIPTTGKAFGLFDFGFRDYEEDISGLIPGPDQSFFMIIQKKLHGVKKLHLIKITPEGIQRTSHSFDDFELVSDKYLQITQYLPSGNIYGTIDLFAAQDDEQGNKTYNPRIVGKGQRYVKKQEIKYKFGTDGNKKFMTHPKKTYYLGKEVIGEIIGEPPFPKEQIKKIQADPKFKTDGTITDKMFEELANNWSLND